MLAFLLYDPLRPLPSRHVAVRQGQCDAHLLQPGGNVERRKRSKHGSILEKEMNIVHLVHFGIFFLNGCFWF